MWHKGKWHIFPTLPPLLSFWKSKAIDKIFLHTSCLYFLILRKYISNVVIYFYEDKSKTVLKMCDCEKYARSLGVWRRDHRFLQKTDHSGPGVSRTPGPEWSVFFPISTLCHSLFFFLFCLYPLFHSRCGFLFGGESFFSWADIILFISTYEKL